MKTCFGQNVKLVAFMVPLAIVTARHLETRNEGLSDSGLPLCRRLSAPRFLVLYLNSNKDSKRNVHGSRQFRKAPFAIHNNECSTTQSKVFGGSQKRGTLSSYLNAIAGESTKLSQIVHNSNPHVYVT